MRIITDIIHFKGTFIISKFFLNSHLTTLRTKKEQKQIINIQINTTYQLTESDLRGLACWVVSPF